MDDLKNLFDASKEAHAPVVVSVPRGTSDEAQVLLAPTVHYCTYWETRR